MKLKWSLTELQRYQDSYLVLDGNVDLEDSLKERKKDLISAGPVGIKGSIHVEESERYFIDLSLKVTLVLPSSRTFEPVEYTLETLFSEIYLAPTVEYTELDNLDELEDELIFTLEDNMIDLKKPIEDTILASIPLKILSKEEMEGKKLPSGSGWEVVLEGEQQQSNKTNEKLNSSPFDILKEIDFKDQEE